MLKVLTRINDKIYILCKWLMMFFLGALTLFVFADVVVRFMGKSLAWTEGIIIYLFSWLTYIGAAVVLRDHGHIGVTAVLSRMPPPIRRAMVLLGQLTILVCSIVIVNLSGKMVGRFLANDQRDHSLLWLKMGWVFLQVPLSYGIFVLFELEQILQPFFAPKTAAEKEKAAETSNLDARS
jgi:TRAP-type C4-dicarboxylate transport system permease small subunit